MSCNIDIQKQDDTSGVKDYALQKAVAICMNDAAISAGYKSWSDMFTSIPELAKLKNTQVEYVINKAIELAIQTKCPQ